ncbi:Sec-independent protein translocase protein TatB [Pseudochelatococcus contaminans]|uniref:Sec-independent protein translocase protein TatB n=1 Tax=Pseudochelatococcus contaminans TaxID=1538103 RepID=A0A7W5Z231_9HYPH|nr:Sec-independent protein translocase protein TatB [Pseudochelatococcus contaminans]MBB3808631.1 sec-independent protein translocase protein TatB [Pseudochelatococcus contaminans]
MFDLSWSELLLVGAIALVVIGPRELPRVLRTAGQMLAKLKRTAADFQAHFSAAMREAELDELHNAVDKVKTAAGHIPSKTFDPLRNVRDELRDAIQKPTSTASSTPGPDGVSRFSSLAENAAAATPPLVHTPANIESLPAEALPKRRKGKRARVIVAAPRDVVKPLASPTRRSSRLYRKVRFSAFPAHPRRTPDREGGA